MSDTSKGFGAGLGAGCGCCSAPFLGCGGLFLLLIVLAVIGSMNSSDTTQNTTTEVRNYATP